MKCLEDSFQTDDGLTLHEKCWLPDEQPDAVLVVVHGVVEHCDRYAEMAETLSRHGVAVHAFDLRGHGRSDGARIWVKRFDRYVADLGIFVDRVAGRDPKTPLFVFGHSMGGAIAGLFAVERPDALAGLVLSAPALAVPDELFPFLRRLAAVGSVLFPRLRLVKMGGSRMSSDPDVVAQFQADPLVFHGRMPTRTGGEILQAGERLLQQSERLAMPLLIMHGTADVVTSPQSSREFHDRAPSTDKTLKLYDGLCHDLPREPGKEQIFADLAKWLVRQVAANG
jgi:acylglycerol lipase